MKEHLKKWKEENPTARPALAMAAVRIPYLRCASPGRRCLPSFTGCRKMEGRGREPKAWSAGRR